MVVELALRIGYSAERGRRAALLNGVHQASCVASEREPASAGYFRLRGERLRNQFKGLLVEHGG